MKTEAKPKLSMGAARARSLSKVLGQSEHVNELVKQSAEELASANTTMKQELATRDPLPGVASALKKSEAVEIKVQDASDKLTVVNKALEGEIRGRDMVDYQLAAAEEQKDAAHDAAIHDVLTGLPNRALFNDRLEHEISQATRRGGMLAVMFVDLDKFKSVNDTHGHEAGDMVLKTAARRLKEHSRDGDTVGRIGGDEFLILLSEIQDEKDPATIAEKIIKAIEVPCDVSVRDLKISPSIGASIGIAIFPQDGATAEALISRADGAMYLAKKSKSGYLFAR